jgi:hypothetical protein
MGTDTLRALNRRSFADSTDLDPRVYWRLTGNWLELAVRFVTPERGVRAVKDAMSREIYWLRRCRHPGGVGYLRGGGAAAAEGGAHRAELQL